MAEEDTSSTALPEVHIVRGIRPDEVDAVLALAGSSGLFTSDAMMAAEDMAWDSAYGEGEEPHTFILAKTAGTDCKVIGFVCYGPIEGWAGNHELYGIAVSPEFQRLGIGSALVAEMRRRIGSGKGGIFLETGGDKAFAGARSFYESNEFEREERFHKHFIPLDGGVVYRLDLSADDDPNYQ